MGEGVARARGAAGAASSRSPGAGGEGRGQAAAGTRFSARLATLLTAEQFKCTILAHSISLEVQRTIHSETELQRHRIPLKEKFTNVAARSLLPCLPRLPSLVGGRRFSLNASVEGIPDQISSASPREARSPGFERWSWVTPRAAPPPASGTPRRPRRPSTGTGGAAPSRSQICGLQSLALRSPCRLHLRRDKDFLIFRDKPGATFLTALDGKCLIFGELELAYIILIKSMAIYFPLRSIPPCN